MALQNYALQNVLKSFGLEVYNLFDKTPVKNRFVYVAKKIVKFFLALSGVKKYQPEFSSTRKARDKKNDSFYEKFLDNKIYITRNSILDPDNKARWSEYDYAIVGSDMVWHWSETEDEFKYYYLAFVEPEKRINYAPSFGLSKYAFENQELHKKYLAEFEKLSCRESSGCELLKNMTGREIVNVLDPSMLLTVDDYKAIAKKPDYEIPEHYVISYFIEELSKDDKRDYKHVIEKVAGGLKNIDVFNPNEKKYFATSPDEWLWLMEHADFIFTNSFHGAVFSILFHKQFISIERRAGGMHQKIEDLLSRFNLNNRIYRNDAKIPDGDINYKFVDEKLNSFRIISIATQYLILSKKKRLLLI